MTATNDPEHSYQSVLNRFEKAEVVEGDKEVIRKFLNAIDHNVSTVNFTNDLGKHETKTY